MKTLKQLGLENHKTSNFADYIKREDPIVCCGLMDVHDDKDNLGSEGNKIFSIKPLYWENSAVFVFKPRKKWHILSKKDFLNGKTVSGVKVKNGAFSFDATKLHGLVPKSIAKKLNHPDYLKSKEYIQFEQKCMKSQKPKLVWKFL
jgi:hypothetical protein